MTFVDTKSRFHVALDGVGLILQGAPDRLAYECAQAPIYETRFGSGDRSYTDFSFWWFFAQTDWSGGLKDSHSWADDAAFFWSTNINTWDEVGGFSLSRKPVLDEDFSENISCGGTAEVGGVDYNFIGTFDAADSRPNLYRAATGTEQTWNEVFGTDIDTTQNSIAQVIGRNSYLWVLTIGSSNTDGVNTYSGSAFVDQTGFIQSVQASQCTSYRCGCEYQGVMYIFGDSTANDYYCLAKTTVSSPTQNSDYTKVLDKTSTSGVPVDVMGFNGTLLFLVNYSGYMELWQYTIASDTTTFLRRFNSSGVTAGTNNVGGRLIFEQNGKAIITIPNNEIWELTTGGTLTRIFSRDTFKKSLTTNLYETSAHLTQGGVIQDNKIWWGNLVYDGTRLYNTWKDVDDTATATHYPVFADTSGNLWMTGSADTSKLYAVDLDGTSYKGTDDKNYLVFSNFNLIPSLDKLAYSLTILFKPLVSGQSIVVEYYLGEMADGISWTALGTASYAIDGGSVRDKTLFFPTATTFKKIWFRVKLNGGGSNTPTVNDFVMNYLPVPTYRKQWALNVNAGDEVKRLDGTLVETTGRELKGRLERAWWTKSVLDFQDFDYATTLLNDASFAADDVTITVDSTYDFPEQGRLRIDDEEITYTGKTPTTFTGCTRGARDTRAVTHSDDSVVNNAYKVIITELKSKIPVALEDKELEYQVGINLREV